MIKKKILKKMIEKIITAATDCRSSKFHQIPSSMNTAEVLKLVVVMHFFYIFYEFIS